MIDRKRFIRFELLSSRGHAIFAAFFRPQAACAVLEPYNLLGYGLQPAPAQIQAPPTTVSLLHFMQHPG